ncbi:signal-transducing adaptor protein 2 isoform X3 [Phacochoerus africanus]|uniref:signal-transducing adaptor protein 2 isoform X3 n=1 Tax=Phacochoerus africanus TaxID=41426 RepID=UPI001FD9EF86|nr:signal-transducing adaptor protein 2 isoform X3 [Phacochoerus africanus]
MAMASALSPPRVPKPKGALPSHYHESFLEKKGPRDQDYKKFWAGLQGLTLYFYNSNRDSQHVEKLDLGAFVKLTDEAPWGSSHDPGTHFCLVLRNQEIKFKVESLESRERWKGFILTVVELRVPSNLTLLPGHLYMMAEALAKEEARRALEMPSCFLKVSRLEAQLLLERYPECGNLLLRPSGDGTGALSVTTRQTLNGTPVVRHYKVKREGPKYVIDVEEPFSCTSIDAVVNYFVSHTNKALVPFLLDEDYEKVIGYVEADKENGESVWVAPSASSASSAPGPGPAPLKGGPKQLPPMPVSSQDKLPPLLHQDENYVIPIGDTPAANYMNEDVPSPSRPVVLKPKKLAKFQAKPPKPPSVPRPEPKVLHSGLARKLAVSSAQAFFPTTGSNHSCGANPSHSRHFSSSGFSTLLKPLPHAPVMLRLLHEPSSASGKLFFAATPQVSATPGNPSSSSSAQPLPESRASLSSGSPQ